VNSNASGDRVVLHASWKRVLLDEFDKPYMRNLRTFLLKERDAGKAVYPRGSEIFAALDLTPIEDVRVVIIGQDPYHGPRQAHGLCFSVQPGVAEPPSLLNIFQEINTDMSDPTVPGGRADGRIQPGHGCLRSWARQGVLLLNAVLTVERGRAGSHQGRGWETFTDRIVEILNEQCDALVFILWGTYAQKKGAIVDRNRHCVLSGPHPSPLSAHRGFFGCRHFSKANRYLVAHGKPPIDWFAVE
jgi:uracil-DNA glycosylase